MSQGKKNERSHADCSRNSKWSIINSECCFLCYGVRRSLLLTLAVSKLGNVGVRAGGGAQSVNYLPYKSEFDPSRICIKNPGEMVNTYLKAQDHGGEVRWIPVVHWLASLNYLGSPSQK